MDQLLQHHTAHPALQRPHTPRPAKRKVEEEVEYEPIELDDDEDRPPKRRRANSLPNMEVSRRGRELAGADTKQRGPSATPSQLTTDATAPLPNNTPAVAEPSAPMACLPPVLPPRDRLRSPSTPLVRSTPRRVAHVPSLTPLITRETLKELDLEAILRNPQLRECPISCSYS